MLGLLLLLVGSAAAARARVAGVVAVATGGGGGSGGMGSGGSRVGAVQRGGSGGGQRQQQQRQSETPSPQQLCEWFAKRGASGCSRTEFGDEAECPRWAELLRPGVDIFALDYDVILAAMYALSASAEGDCYLCVPPDPGIEAAALGASESALPGTAPAEALHTFTLDTGASRCFFRISTTLTPLSTLVPVRLVDPSGGPVLFRSSAVLPCLASARHSSLLLVSLMTAPLQTLHVDVWGSARVSGQGRERYFLLVVDDYTRYTMVFPLCSKGEDLPVLRLHSDRGGEFSSDLLRDFCRGEGILQSFTLPTSPQQNGIAECRIGLVMEVARTSMIHAAASHFLWPFAVRYAAHQLNLWPRVSLPETSPTPRWAEKVGDASVFRVGGPRAFVRDTSADKLSSRAIPCVFLSFPPDVHGWQFYHPTSRRVLPSLDVTFNKSVTFYRLFPYRSAPVPPPPLFLAPGPPPVDPLPPRGPAPSGVCQVDPLPGIVPVEVAVDSGATQGTASGGAASGGAEPASAELGGAEPAVAEPGGAESEGAEPGGPAPEGAEPWASGAGGFIAGGSAARGTRAGGAGATSLGGAGVPAGAGGTGDGGAGGGDPGAGGTGAGGNGAEGTGAGSAGDGGAGAGGAGAGDPNAGGARAVDPGAGGAGAGGVASGGTGAGGTVQRRPFFVPPPRSSLPPPDSVLHQVLSLPSSTSLPPSLLSPRPRHSQPQLQPDSSLPAPSPYAEQTYSFIESRKPTSRPASPVRADRTSRRAPRPRPPPVPGTHVMALRPSSVPLRAPLPPPLESSLPAVPDPESHLVRAASPAVSHLLATVVTDPSFESTAASALVAELVDFAVSCRLNYATSLVVESESVCPLSVGGECALGTDVLEDRLEDFECLAAATSMDAEMASWKSTGTVDAVPPSGANIVDGMWIFRVKRPPGSPPAFKARYVARGFRQRQGVDFFQNFSPTPKMTTLRVLLHVAAQREYELRSLDFSTAFLQGSLHEEIWLRHPPGFTRSFPAGTQWSLRRIVYGLRQAPRESHNTLRMTLVALGFAPSSADPSLFLRTDTSLPPFYVLVYVDNLVLATAYTETLALVKSELQKRHTCTDQGELTSYLGLRINRDRAQCTITLTQSHMVQQVLQRFGFTYSSPQSTPLPTSHSLSAPPSNECVESSGLYPELLGYLMYLMTCIRPDLAYSLSILARYVAPKRHRPEHWEVAKRVLCYLCSTSGMGLVLGGRGQVVLTGHGDASWVDDLATQRLSQGYTFTLGSGCVSWRSTHSSLVLSSSCEAEIYAGAMAA
ncbi:unnamed protein product [Closterium sp. NIES-53]